MAGGLTCAHCGRRIEAEEFPPFCPNCGEDPKIARQPYASPAAEEPVQAPRAAPGELSARQAYNIATDIGGGPNLRRRDNLLQALAIFVSIVLGIAIGLAVTRGKPDGAIVGGAIGLLAGLFGSGIFLMIFRFVQHVRGKHD